MCVRAKDYLREIKKKDMAIQHMVRELDEIRSMQSFIGSMDYSKDRVQTSASDASYTSVIERLVDMQIKINNEIDRYVNFKHSVNQILNTLNKPEHSEILYKRYFEYKTLEQIACELFVSYYRACHIHGEALKAFNDKLLQIDTSK